MRARTRARDAACKKERYYARFRLVKKPAALTIRAGQRQNCRSGRVEV
jgi:hypothetical protein